MLALVGEVVKRDPEHTAEDAEDAEGPQRNPKKRSVFLCGPSASSASSAVCSKGGVWGTNTA
jgi:hypothetical protein